MEENTINVLLCEHQPVHRNAMVAAIDQIAADLLPFRVHFDVVPAASLEAHTLRPIYDVMLLDVTVGAPYLAVAERQVWARLFYLSTPGQRDHLEHVLTQTKGSYLVKDDAFAYLNLLRMELRLIAKHRSQKFVPLSKRELRFATALRAGGTGFFELATDLSRGFICPNCGHYLAREKGLIPELKFFWLWFRRRIHPADGTRLVRQLRQLLNGDTNQLEIEIRFQMEPPAYQWLAVSVHALSSDPNGRCLAVAGTMKDITARKTVEEENFRRANYDPLTNLPNRVLFFDRLSQATKMVARRGGKLAVLFIDLNRFKWVNDFLGHRCGDKLLQIAARRFEGCMRESDTVARLGGDEFIAVLSDLSDRDGAERVAEKILKRLKEPFALDGEEVSISGSIGISVYPDDGRNAEELLQFADTAMYAAKDYSDNTFRFYNKRLSIDTTRRISLAKDLPKALDKNEFRVFYQPLIDPETGRIVAVEALLRWQHPQHGLLLPEAFLELAETSGLISPIGMWVVRQACGQVNQWREQGLPRLNLNINLSSRQCLDEQFCDVLAGVLDEQKFPPQDLALEVDADCIANSHRHQAFFKQIAQLKVKLVIDHFGGSASPLDWLTQFPVNSVKLDRAFLAKSEHDQNTTRICQAITDLAHKLDLNVVGEGVENVEQLGFFSSCECDLVQGFLFTEPLPAHQFENIARHREWDLAALGMRDQTLPK
ncbi:putative bifunctional diguanylate cyclase/phosphodiesterase [Acanthopleuribacter pedis]|uniref:EAL domain-containing protein n=1 Tax=Acanthopleuribacter pedis TaxID=442870 RepID=A0A8J7U0G6_9BACT|nr:EAL domain-containing protein [Acanthopleuribacter pedis]MBO1317043.1 EAL domain-containing protein [Acanthopleuribacter pedis]